MSEESMSPETLPSPPKMIIKNNEGLGFNITLKGGRLKIERPESSMVNPQHLPAVEADINRAAKSILAISPDSARNMITTLVDYAEQDEYTDLIMFGPPKKGNIQDRMGRLKIVRDKATETQNNAPQNEKADTIKAATFVRSQIHILGLKTTINVLNAVAEK